jgi:hypothetical protein
MWGVSQFTNSCPTAGTEKATTAAARPTKDLGTMGSSAGKEWVEKS